MSILKCMICGGDIDVESCINLGTCQFCRTTMTIPAIDSERGSVIQPSHSVFEQF